MLTTIIIVMVIFFAAMAYMGIAGKKHSKDFETSMNMARSAGPIFIIGSAVGAHVGNGFVVGGAGDGAAMGLAGALYGLGCALSYLVFGVLVTKYLYRGNYLSLKDFLSKRYGDKLTSIIYDVATTLSYIGNIGAQMMAGGALFEALGFNPAIGIIAIGVIVFVYTQLGGIWGSQATSTVQTVIIFFTLVSTAVIIACKGGLAQIQAIKGVEDGYFHLFSVSFPRLISLTIPTSISTLVDQACIQRVNTARDEKTAVAGYIYGGLCLVPLAFLPTFVGMYGRAVYGATDKVAFFNVILNELPPILAAVAVCAVLSAVMSTISGFYAAFSATIIKDIYHDLINPNASDKQCFSLSVVFSAIATVGSVLIALYAGSIIDLLCATYIFIGSCCLVPFLAGIVWKKGNAKGAVASTIVGVIVCILDMTGVLNPTFPEIFPLIFALAAYIIVSLATQDKSAAE